MKKILILITVIGVLTLALGSFAFAVENEDTPQWFKDMITWKKQQVQQAVQDGNLTDDQAKAWNERFDDMEKWHAENGFNMNGIRPGGCHGGFGKGTGFKGGLGRGMGYQGL